MLDRPDESNIQELLDFLFHLNLKLYFEVLLGLLDWPCFFFDIEFIHENYGSNLGFSTRKHL